MDEGSRLVRCKHPFQISNMKKLSFLLLAAWMLGVSGQAEDAKVEIPVVTPQEASQHEGQVVTVKGKVDGQRTTASGTTFLNFGGRHPNQVFSCRAFADKFPEGVPACEGKTVEVTGKIKMHEGKPSMDLQGPDKIKVLETEEGAEKPAS